MRKIEVFVFYLIILMNILFISIGGAFEYHENSLQKDYRAGEIIKGSVNLSLKQERKNSQNNKQVNSKK